MISYLFRSSKSNNFSKLDKYKSGAWIYVEDPTQDEIEKLAEDHNLKAGIMYDVFDEDEMPRLERDDGANYLYTRFVYEHKDLQVTTETILVIIRDDLFMTLSVKPLPNVENILHESNDVFTTMRTKLFIQILNAIVDDYDRQLTKVERQVKVIRNKLRGEEVTNQDFINFVLIEDELNEFLTVLTPTTAILKRLLIGKHIKLYSEDEDIVEDLMLNTQQSIEESKAILRTIVNIREAYSTISTNNLNRIIRILTVLTTVLAVPTLIASIYGMNVKLPIDRNPEAFTVIMLISLAISIILLLFFRWRKWL